MASAQGSLFGEPEQLDVHEQVLMKVHAVMTASVELIGVKAFFGKLPVTLPGDITAEEHASLMRAAVTTTKPMHCVVEMRYHTGRLAVPVGPVTVETSAGGMIYIQVDGRIMFTLHPDQQDIFNRHIAETVTTQPLPGE